MSVKWKRLSGIVLSAVLISTALAGCGDKTPKAPTDYDFYIFNGKSENAEAMEKIVNQYAEERDLTIKVFSLGTTDVAETLRSEMNSDHKPAIFSTNIGGVAEWAESKAAMDLNEATNPELKALGRSGALSHASQHGRDTKSRDSL